MAKYIIVPVELPVQTLVAVCNSDHPNDYQQVAQTWVEILAARPPLDDEMQKALELAHGWNNAWGKAEFIGVTGDLLILARALLRANGEE